MKRRVQRYTELDKVTVKN